MKLNFSITSLFCLLMGQGVFYPICAQPPQQQHPRALHPEGFIENTGQMRSDVAFYQQAAHGWVLASPTGITHYFSGEASSSSAECLDLVLVNSKICKWEGSDQLPEQMFYYSNLAYNGSDPVTMRAFRQLTAKEVYPGVDWVLSAQKGGYKHEFIVRPGGDPSRIKWQYPGATSLKVNADGSLNINTLQGVFYEKAPVSYQQEQIIASKFIVSGNSVSLWLDNYDPKLPLRIDPEISWATYYGSTDSDSAEAVVTDAAGNVYMAGISSSMMQLSHLALTQTYSGGVIDFYLVKFDAAGNRIWCNYFGGNSQEESPRLAVDHQGNILLTGNTLSINNIHQNGHQSNNGGNGDALLAKFSPQGQRIWGTYYGGFFQDIGYAITVDAQNSIYIAGRTASTTGIVEGPAHQVQNAGNGDAFLAKFSSAGQRLWSTYFGGGAEDIGYALTTDAHSNVYMAGYTRSSNQIATSGNWQTQYQAEGDAFLVSFDSQGVHRWGMYYGGLQLDQFHTLSTGPEGTLYAAGSTASPTDIAFNGAQMQYGGNLADAFLVKFDTSGQRIWATYLGAGGIETNRGLATDNAGQVFIAGSTTSFQNFAQNGYQNIYGGGSEDAYIGKIGPSGNLEWLSYYGSIGGDLGNDITLDPSGEHIYLAGRTNSNTNVSFNGFQNNYQGGIRDGFLLKMTTAANPTTVSQTPSTKQFTLFPSPADKQVCLLADGETPNIWMTWRMADMHGRTIIQENSAPFPNGASHCFDVATLPQGIYMLMAQDIQGRYWTGRFLKL